MNLTRADAIQILGDISALVLDSLEEFEVRRYDISWKSDGSPVTAADVWLENRIIELLRGRDSSVTVVGEESWTDEAYSHGLVALIDPIDGTENFCSGLKEWGVSVGLWSQGKFLASLLLLPELGLQAISGTAVPVRRSRITGFSSSYCDAIATGIRDADEYRVSGCAVYNLYSVITGSFARFVNPKGARVWDLLPGLALALENNCEVLLDDKPYDGGLLDPAGRYRVDIRNRHNLHSGQGA